jgi:hypothetical protein
MIMEQPSGPAAAIRAFGCRGPPVSTLDERYS